jgi:hypothetical protein
MPRSDYEAISKIVKDVVGEDTLITEKILEGIKFYFDNKVETFKVIKAEGVSMNFQSADISRHKRGAKEAMERYTEKLKKESKKFKKKTEQLCAVGGD